jgi:uncharacterized protein YcgI (DUF1989 family)
VDALIVPPGEGRAVRVPSGARFRVVDVEGGQVADLFAFVDGPAAEWMSAEHTRPGIGRLFPKPGDVILSNRRRPMARLEEDRSPGRHDTLYAACDPARYELLGVTGPHRSCATNLAEALDRLNGDDRGSDPTVVPQPFNLFMEVEVRSDGALAVRPASSQPGDSVTFSALTDLVVVVSSCPMDVIAISTGGVTSLAIEVFRPS